MLLKGWDDMQKTGKKSFRRPSSMERMVIITLAVFAGSAICEAGAAIAGFVKDPAPFVDCSYDLDEAKKAAESVNAFAFGLYAKLAEEEGNIFFSPQNVSAAFAMVYAGAERETEREIREVFHYGDDAHAEMRSLQNL
ncbi:MAG: hypothetical protein LBT15_02015, partial [Synergistaceae bacterium]|nr:hypothetical protein [Synergistaceae bacterium]